MIQLKRTYLFTYTLPKNEAPFLSPDLNQYVNLNCYRLHLPMWTWISLALTQEIHLESFDDGPGILPFKMGPTKVVSHYHTFLQSIQLGKLHDDIDLIKTQLTNASNSLANNTFRFFQSQIKYLYAKLNKVSAQLSTFSSKRVRRGLIDPLGSVIKSISGNLDHNDAIRYDHALKILKNNDEKLSKTFNEHISLNKKWMVEHKKILSALNTNQQILSKDLLNLKNDSMLSNGKLLDYAHLAQMFNIVSENINDLYTELLRIENILAFSKLSNVHHSILSISSLKDMIGKLHEIYSKDQILDLDTRDYYSFINVGSYFSKNDLVVVLKVPIICQGSFDFYKLCPLPNKYGRILIPPYPFIATNPQEYVYVEAECPKSGDWYICQQKLSHQIRTERDCIHKLIHLQEIDGTCKTTPISLSKEALLELDDQHYAITFPNPTKVQINCQQEQHIILNGSYVATIPQHCSLKSSQFTIVNINNKLRGQPLKIMSIQPETRSQQSSPMLRMNSINLSNLEAIEQQISMEKPIETNAIQSSTLYHTTLPLYLIILFGAGVTAFILYRKHRARAKVDIKQDNIELKKAATFALNLANSSST
ncbi:uncharacterized protein [Choristoneura fumiferana]|uniref:uncharacterized protein n=1 Tax=Choristoneura fumiferana TaxID=7141 RepID=UPI003D15B94C